MRPMLFGVLALSFAHIGSARAQIDYPYCIHVYSRDQYVDCSFSTMAQCKATASGRPAQCYLDPFYKGRPGSAYYVGPRYRHNLDGFYDPYTVQEPAAQPRRPHKHRRTGHHSRS
ncbi:MAG: DUF3551 domain-containing protein [Xanthobacteraceae bacterium]|nr:DUF3551 domain-containing protein [Xanthobacteraceae bacterium]